MSEVFKRNKKHNKRQSASAARKKGNQDNEMNDMQTMASSSSGNNLSPNSAQAITLHEFFISKGNNYIFFYNFIHNKLINNVKLNSKSVECMLNIILRRQYCFTSSWCKCIIKNTFF